MGPPREHGGKDRAELLDRARVEASMGPPREHGGKMSDAMLLAASSTQLQWGRRVNTAESHSARPTCRREAESGFNGAAA